MSDRILKLVSQETNLTQTRSTAGNTQLVRLRNSGATSYSIMVRTGGSDTIVGSMTLYPNEVVYIRKASSETIESTATNTDVRIVSVAFGD